MGGGPLRIPGGGPFMLDVLPLPLPAGPLPLTAPFIIALGGGMDDNLTGGVPATGDVTGWSFLC